MPRHTGHQQQQCKAVARYFIARLAVLHHGLSNWSGEFFDEGDFKRQIQLSDWPFAWNSLLDEQTDTFMLVLELEVQLLNQLPALEAAARPVIDRFRQRMAECLALSATEADILLFFLIKRESVCLQKIFTACLEPWNNGDCSCLARAIDVPEEILHGVFYQAGALNALEIIEYNDERIPVDVTLEAMLGQALLFAKDGMASLRARLAITPPAANLKRTHYAHCANELELLVAILQKPQSAGLNLLLYGPPGTGKTELTRLLGKLSGRQVLEVPAMTHTGAMLPREQRIARLKLLQALCAQSDRFLIVMDEAEDCFAVPQANLPGKAWTNHLLEHNRCPTLWVCNAIDWGDPAYFRRFSYSLELLPAAGEQGLKLARQYLKPYLPAKVVRELALLPDITPAQLRQLQQVLQTLDDPDRAEAHARLWLAASRKLLRQEPEETPKADRRPLSALYAPEFLNATPLDVAGWTQAIREQGEARLCFYGPPGTGKTELAHYLARSAQRQTLVKRVSDLVSKYVGDTEKAIARSFAEAREQGAVLILDEADSFLRNRQTAQQHWEITEVNEWLACLDDFRGVVICTTNLMHELDPAVLRRFDAKIGFDYLRPEQAWALFTRLCKTQQLVLPRQSARLRAEIEQLSRLTPGDFAVVERRSRLLGAKEASTALEWLKAEVSAKAGPRSRMGFI